MKWFSLIVIFFLIGMYAYAKPNPKPNRGFQKLILKLPSSGRIFSLKDKICFFPENGRVPIACGRIYAIRSDKMFVKIFYQKKRIRGGVNYELAKLVSMKKTKGRKRSFTFADRVLYQVLYERNLYKYEFGLGIFGGIAYVFPALQAQIWLGKHFSVGLRPFYVNSKTTSATLRAWGTFAHVNYYFGKERYSGFYGEFGIGPYVFTEGDGVNNRPSVARLAASIGGGWRWRHSTSGFNFGILAGLQYFSNPELKLIRNDTHGLLTLVVFDVGYAF